MATARIDNYLSLADIVQMTLGTDRGTFFADSTFGSDLFILRRTGKLLPETLITLKGEIERSLQWLVGDGLVDHIDVVVAQSGKSRIDYSITLFKPDGTDEEVEGVWEATYGPA